MKLKLKNSKITFGSLIKLFSVGYFIGMGILMLLIFVPVCYLKYGDTWPVFFWLMFPVMIAVQSLLIAVVVAAGLTLYGKVGKWELVTVEPLQQPAAPDRR